MSNSKAKSAPAKKNRPAAKRCACGLCSAKTIEKKVERVCAAKPAAFLTGLYPLVVELVDFVKESYRREPEKSEKTFAVLARSMEKIYRRLDAGGDITDCVLRRPTVPDADGRKYSYDAVTAKMTRLRDQCLNMTVARGCKLLPEKFRELTWLFSFACGKDFDKRWQLLEHYFDLLADMWGCAKALSGDEDTGEWKME